MFEFMEIDRNVQKCIGMYWNVWPYNIMECRGMYRIISEFIRICQKVQECIAIFRNVQECIREMRNVLESIGMFEYMEMYRNVQKCIGMYWNVWPYNIMECRGMYRIISEFIRINQKVQGWIGILRNV